MNGLVFESVLLIVVALVFIGWGVWQLRRWDRQTWQEPVVPSQQSTGSDQSGTKPLT